MYHPTPSQLSWKRDWADGYWENSNGARWAFFAIFIVLIIVVVLGTIRVNKRRARHGVQPIYGTRWMTPPNYRQSQTAYQQPDHLRDPDLPSAYVPTYTATANENDYDMGYYDAQGVFHSNPNAKSMMQRPPEARTRDGLRRVSDEHADVDELGDVTRPSGPPPPQQSQQAHQQRGEIDEIVEVERYSISDSNSSFARPEGPPPSGTVGSSSSTSSEKATPVQVTTLERKK
ncbi:uncharacterized protein LODBEIA_P36530 [Lodderomyces beijingensis]|uniref:Uncharacterized protein n=1 Tax=Lodderomyces beijingensis TaxID=1775926 RepID=A0ABP0ZMQ6_9ASCO